MTEVTFYHLTATTLDEALPTLVERSLERKWRVAIQMVSEEKVAEMDDLLWSYQPASFLPHGRDGDENPADHPVFVTETQENPNAANMRFLIDEARFPADLSAYARVALMFDGGNEGVVQKARNDWRALKEQGHELAYWKQSPEGKWEKTA